MGILGHISDRDQDDEAFGRKHTIPTGHCYALKHELTAYLKRSHETFEQSDDVPDEATSDVHYLARH